jgi:hypothetical protein
MRLTPGWVSGSCIREEKKETNKTGAEEGKRSFACRSPGHLIRVFDVRSPIPQVLKAGVWGGGGSGGAFWK